MSSLDSLRAQAARTTNARNHHMRWQLVFPYGGAAWHGRCVKCGMEVVVMSAPQANEINIGGTAVAMNCTHIEGKKYGRKR